MIPMILKIKIPKAGKEPTSLYLPLFLLYILLLPVCVLLLPFYLLVLLISMLKGYGKIVLMFIPMIGAILWNLQGLKIDVHDEDTDIYLSFI
jgi:hypothetical protein